MVRFKIKVYQFVNSDPIATFKFNVASEQKKKQATEWLRDWLDGDEIGQFITSHEIHILRFLRHIREPLEGLPKLDPEMFEFWFDNPENNEMRRIDPTVDGDFVGRIPGGFFNDRFSELP